ncbi:MAG: PadR family transcriptional regulator [bacterium]|nr:PadR family transcriptional regulator [bacterium]
MTSTVEIQNLTRSCNEALILAVLSTGPRHGYQLALEIEERSGGEFRFNHGTLYPILHKLEKDGLITGDWQQEAAKRKRKSYALTKAGRRHAARQTQAWRAFFDRFFAIVGDVAP